MARYAAVGPTSTGQNYLSTALALGTGDKKKAAMFSPFSSGGGTFK